MRWLFLFVLVLNIAYISWQLNVSEVDGYVSSVTMDVVSSDSKSIILLSELKAREKAASKSEPLDIPVTEKVLPTTENNPAVAEADEVVSTDNKQQSGKAQAESGNEAALAAQIEGKPKEQVNGCYTIGPFRDIEKLRGFVREIKSYVVEADFRDLEEKRRSVFWVYIKPEKNRKKAIATSKRLKARKIKDFYIIREGEKNNGISLGHFKNKKRAYKLAKKVKKLGFDVAVKPLFKTYTLYWLDYQLGSGDSLPQTVVDKYLQTKGNNKISQLSRDCVP